MPVTTSAQRILRHSLMDSESKIPESFWELVEQYRAELLNQALMITGTMADAEDVVQETFCEAMRGREELAKVRSVRAWLRAINRANALDHQRNRKRDVDRTKRKQQQAPDRAVTTGGFSMLELRDSVAGAIDTLPPKLRTVILLRYWEQLSYDEVASRMNVTPSAVWHLLHDATLKLYGRLKVHVDAPQAAPSTSSPTEQDEDESKEGEPDHSASRVGGSA